jgi:hypothetical protein
MRRQATGGFLRRLEQDGAAGAADGTWAVRAAGATGVVVRHMFLLCESCEQSRGLLVGQVATGERPRDDTGA